jgi:hypothetical protein
VVTKIVRVTIALLVPLVWLVVVVVVAVSVVAMMVLITTFVVRLRKIDHVRLTNTNHSNPENEPKP